MDVKVLFKTVVTVLKSENVYVSTDKNIEEKAKEATENAASSKK
jgi:hypothetical protein